MALLECQVGLKLGGLCLCSQMLDQRCAPPPPDSHEFFNQNTHTHTHTPQYRGRKKYSALLSSWGLVCILFTSYALCRCVSCSHLCRDQMSVMGAVHIALELGPWDLGLTHSATVAVLWDLGSCLCLPVLGLIAQVTRPWSWGCNSLPHTWCTELFVSPSLNSSCLCLCRYKRYKCIVFDILLLVE